MVDILIGVAGFSIGFGLASFRISRTINKRLEQLHKDNEAYQKYLIWADENVTRKVEEQNMHSVLKRIDQLEATE